MVPVASVAVHSVLAKAEPASESRYTRLPAASGASRGTSGARSSESGDGAAVEAVPASASMIAGSSIIWQPGIPGYYSKRTGYNNYYYNYTELALFAARGRDHGRDGCPRLVSHSTVYACIIL